MRLASSHEHKWCGTLETSCVSRPLNDDGATRDIKQHNNQNHNHNNANNATDSSRLINDMHLHIIKAIILGSDILYTGVPFAAQVSEDSLSEESGLEATALLLFEG